LDKARAQCNQKIEDALFDIYNYASKHEYNQPFKECDRLTTLQEELEKNAIILEKTERTTVCKSKILIEARARNKALRSRNELNLAVLLSRIPAKKLREYVKYPLAFRIGFIHSILEKEFDIASTTITDIGFLGLFPKSLLQILYRYANKIENHNNDKDEFVTLIEKLITAFIYRPVTLQKIIQILISSKKSEIQNEQQNEQDDANFEFTNNEENDSMSIQDSNTSAKPSEKTSTPKNASVAPTQRPCYANKCRLLRAKGILRRPTFCANNKSMCSGCMNENLRHRKVIQIEKDILNDYSSNEALAPIISYLTIPTDLKRICKLLLHLPAYKNNKRDDHIYGATRYVANSLGILLNDANANSSIDSPMTTVEKNLSWRVATLHCRCDYDTTLQKRFNIRTFCTVCLCLVF